MSTHIEDVETTPGPVSLTQFYGGERYRDDSGQCEQGGLF